MSSADNFANFLEPDVTWVQQFDIPLLFLKEFFENINFEQINQQTSSNHAKLPRMQSVNAVVSEYQVNIQHSYVTDQI